MKRKHLVRVKFEWERREAEMEWNYTLMLGANVWMVTISWEWCKWEKYTEWEFKFGAEEDKHFLAWCTPDGYMVGNWVDFSTVPAKIPQDTRDLDPTDLQKVASIFCLACKAWEHAINALGGWSQAVWFTRSKVNEAEKSSPKWRSSKRAWDLWKTSKGINQERRRLKRFSMGEWND